MTRPPSFGRVVFLLLGAVRSFLWIGLPIWLLGITLMRSSARFARAHLRWFR